jgi:hypothetical protein
MQNDRASAQRGPESDVAVHGPGSSYLDAGDCGSRTLSGHARPHSGPSVQGWVVAISLVVPISMVRYPPSADSTSRSRARSGNLLRFAGHGRSSHPRCPRDAGRSPVSADLERGVRFRRAPGRGNDLPDRGDSVQADSGPPGRRPARLGHVSLREAAIIGGSATVRGLPAQRFRGDASAYANAELRVRLTKLSLVVPGQLGVLASAYVRRRRVKSVSEGIEKRHEAVPPAGSAPALNPRVASDIRTR